MKTDTIILGAGISGLTSGWNLVRHGRPALILEASHQIGGLCSTYRDGDFFMDYGPHSFLTADPEMTTLARSFLKTDANLLERKARLFFEGKFLDYPFTPSSLYFQMGLKNFITTLCSALKNSFRCPTGSFKKTSELSFEDWALKRFGRHLYESFFKPYTEQFWKLPASDLSPDVMPARLQLTFTKVLKSLFCTPGRSAAASQIDREKLPTLYPQSGFGALPEKIAQAFLELGGRIETACRVKNINRSSCGALTITYMKDNSTQTVTAQHIISTIPISSLIPLLMPSAPAHIASAASSLEYLPLQILGILATSRSENILKNTLYTYFLDRPYHRIFKAQAFSMSACQPGKTLLGLEMTCPLDDENCVPDKNDLLQKCLPFLEKDLKLKRSEIEHFFVLKANHAYPLYRKGYTQPLDSVTSWLHSHFPGIRFVGRQSEFRYMDADECMQHAILLTQNILKEDSDDKNP